ncbi:MAG TPA: hypothetical protein VEX37_03665 [Thermomicrobiales bacterium]|nr:hypothetical protein [Thermomicrobiales bacterium]
MGEQMRWLLQRGDNADDAPKLLTLEEPPDEEIVPPAGIAALPEGALSVTVRSAAEARDTLAELQRVQQQLLTARARAAAGGVQSIGSNVSRQIQRPGRHIWRAARGFRPSGPASRVRQSSATVFDGLDAALLLAQTAGGIDDALKLVGSAIEVVGDVVSSIDLGDFDFD